MSFAQACSLVAIDEPEIRGVVHDDALKALISDMHFSGKMPLKQLAMRLGLSLSRVIKAKEGILQDEAAGINGPRDSAR